MARRAPLRPALVRLAIPAAILVLLGLALHFVATVHVVAGDAPPLLAGDRLLIDRRAYRAHPPRRGEVVVAEARRAALLGRVLALPGETIAIRAGAVLLGGAPLPRWRIADAVVAGCAEPAADADCRSPRARTAFPDGRMLDLPDGIEVPRRTLPRGRLLLIDADGATHVVTSADVIGRAGIVVVSVRGAARADRPATWLHAVRWERSGLRL